MRPRTGREVRGRMRVRRSTRPRRESTDGRPRREERRYRRTSPRSAPLYRRASGSAPSAPTWAIAALSVVVPSAVFTLVGTIGVLGRVAPLGAVEASGPFGYAGVVDRLGFLGELAVSGPLGESGVLRGRLSPTVRDVTVNSDDRSAAIDAIRASGAIDAIDPIDAIHVVGALVGLVVVLTSWAGTIATVHLVVRVVARRR